MADEGKREELSAFLSTGIYRLGTANDVVFIDPPRVLNCGYTRFRVSASAYYERPFSLGSGQTQRKDASPILNSKGRKRKRKEYVLNERERAAEERHQDGRLFLLKAHQLFLGATELLHCLSNLKRDNLLDMKYEKAPFAKEEEFSFVDLGNLWQAPFYEISLHFLTPKTEYINEVVTGLENGGGSVQIFNNLVTNSSNDDMKAEFLGNWYILPKQSCFYMSDLEQIHNLIPASCDQGFNLILIDPPWENKSVQRKLVYPTLPNRYFLSIPIKQLIHSEGALVALWVTNREKLRMFVEKELFPVWGVTHVASVYWLKVSEDGNLISELDLFHHKPYELLLLGYCHAKGPSSVDEGVFKSLPDNQVIISIPGAHSRKPPIGKLLLNYSPGPRPVKCLELFARELVAGWTSWGNEPLLFQDSRYFLR
ncbi:methyltransferase-like protein 2 isoform X2 [Nymphaea colorata]|uniref:methyltransferase-like protein 2 isoform X2 n=1 Tax=Nymphaea colorata TaxID=210225 RepID=UPI00129DAF01|nr:methyltransferase-like protein 2 isoform X2 [Nymphaea colorata]